MSSKTAIEKQMAIRLFLLPTQTTQSIFNHHPSHFQIDLSSDLILQNLKALNKAEGTVLHLHNLLDTGEHSTSLSLLT